MDWISHVAKPLCDEASMTLLLFIAAGFLALSAALFFGPHAVAYGLPGLRDAFRRPEAQVIAGALATALALLLFAPVAASTLIPGGETVQVVAETLTGQRFA